MLEKKEEGWSFQNLDNENNNYFFEHNYNNTEYRIAFDMILSRLEFEQRRNALLTKLLQNYIKRDNVDDFKAEQEVRDYIRKKRCEGKTRISILDFMDDLKLPSDQINRIMKKLESEGIRELD